MFLINVCALMHCIRNCDSIKQKVSEMWLKHTKLAIMGVF